MSYCHRLAAWWGFPLILLFSLVLAGAAQAEYLGNVTFDQEFNTHLPHGLLVNVDIDYKIDHPDGRRIYIVPYTNGSPTPGYGVSASVVYPQGTGTVTKFFTINTGSPVVVNELRVYSRDPDFTETPLEMFVPVRFHFGPHGVYNIQPNHSQYSRLRHGMSLNITMDYEVDAPGCRIYARPFTNGTITPGYSASGSVALPPSGSHSQNFSFAGDADVTDIRFQVLALDNTLLYEFFVPWDIHWAEWGVYDISINHGNPTSLQNGQHLVSSFTMDHEDTEDVWITMWCWQDGGQCPGSLAQISPVIPTGPQALSRYAYVNEGTQTVDAVHFQVTKLAQVVMEIDIPVLIDYGPNALQNFEFTPASPAILSYGEQLGMTYDYLTDEASGVRIFGRGAFNYDPLLGMTSSGSTIHPPPSGPGSFWMTYNTDTVANLIRFQMVSPDQSEMHLEWFQPGYFVWGSSGTVVDAEDTPAVARLGLCYPNPFNPTTNIPVSLGRDSHMRLTVYDLRGRLVRTLKDGPMWAGDHVFTFRGDGLSSGAYICRLETPEGIHTQRITLVK